MIEFNKPLYQQTLEDLGIKVLSVVFEETDEGWQLISEVCRPDSPEGHYSTVSHGFREKEVYGYAGMPKLLAQNAAKMYERLGAN